MDDETKARIVRLENGLQRVEVKLNNGMTDSLSRIDTRVERIEKIVTNLVHTEDPAVRLANCPYRKLVEEQIGHKQKLCFALYAILVAAAAGAPAWIVLLLNR